MQYSPRYGQCVYEKSSVGKMICELLKVITVEREIMHNFKNEIAVASNYNLNELVLHHPE